MLRGKKGEVVQTGRRRLRVEAADIRRGEAKKLVLSWLDLLGIAEGIDRSLWELARNRLGNKGRLDAKIFN